MTTGASWPWNLSTVPTARAGRQRLASMRDLGVVRGDDQDVVDGQRTRLPVAVGERCRRSSNWRTASAMTADLLGRRVAVARVRHLEHADAGAGQRSLGGIDCAASDGSGSSRSS